LHKAKEKSTYYNYKMKIITIIIILNPSTPNDVYSGRTPPLTSKLCILYISSTNIGTEYFKRGIHSPSFFFKCSLFHNSNVFGSCIIHILYTECAKIKKNNSGAKRLIYCNVFYRCAVHFEIYAVHTPTNALFINLVKSFKSKTFNQVHKYCICW
jgi:hypothetical protein